MKNFFRRPTLGLTLGGGGARGGAHIGVLRILDEIGYQPDIIVGASIGAFVAALVGAKFSLPDVERIFKQSNLTDVIHPARHGQSLLDNHGYEDMLTVHFGDADLRDLSPRIGISTTDMRGKKRVLLQEGSVVKAILASTAVPGLFAPIEWGDFLLVDGGILDNVPTKDH
jgi:NTE family protein